jgi:hypothetical protein
MWEVFVVDTTSHVSKLSACALGFALGLTWALGMLILGVLAWSFHVGEKWVELISTVYVGFAATPVGVLIGTLWAFVEGYISGFVLAVIYNFSARHCPCPNCNPRVKVEEVVKE